MPDNAVYCHLETEHNDPIELTENEDSHILSFENGNNEVHPLRHN